MASELRKFIHKSNPLKIEPLKTKTFETKPKSLAKYFKEFPQVRQRRKKQIIHELNLNLSIPLRQFNSSQLINLHTKLEYRNGLEALQHYKVIQSTHLKKLKQLGLVRASRVRRGLPIKGRTHSNGKTARRSSSRKLINQK